MNDLIQAARTPGDPIRRMRVTFWGVQGSCPIFPTPIGLEQYSRKVALYTLMRAMEKLQSLAVLSPDGRVHPADLVGRNPAPIAIEKLQQQLGLPDLPIYGGETTCVEIETNEGNKLILDAGSGLRRCSIKIVNQWKDRADRTLHIFGSHEHLDHRMGLTFSQFCYVGDRPFTLHIHGPHQFLRALDQHYGLFSHETSDATYVDDPVDYTMMPAKFVGHELRPAEAHTASPHWDVLPLGQPIRIGRTTVTPFEVYHVIPLCLGYLVEHDGARFVFATDHEQRRGDDPTHPRQQRSNRIETRLREICRGADLAYFDGQYFLDEYLGKKAIGSSPPMPRLDWGHSCVEDVVERAFACGVKHTMIGHHDPERTWTERLEMDRQLIRLCQGKDCQIELADGDQVVEL